MSYPTDIAVQEEVTAAWLNAVKNKNIKSVVAGETIAVGDILTSRQHFVAVATDDAGLHEASPSSNYGSDQYVLFGRGGGGSGDDNYAALKFNLASLPAAVDKVELVFYIDGAAGGAAASSIMRVTSADWAEGTINYGNMPTGTDILTGLTFTAGFNVFDITTTYNAWKAGTYNNYGLILKAEGTGAVNLMMSEHVSATVRPMIIITTREAKIYKVDPTSTYETGSILGFAITAGNLNDTIYYQTSGVISGLSGLEQGGIYYLADNGTLSLTPGTIETKIGKALSDTELLLEYGEHEYLGAIGLISGSVPTILVPRGATRAIVSVSGSQGSSQEMTVMKFGKTAASAYDDSTNTDSILGVTWVNTGTRLDILVPTASGSSTLAGATAWFFR